MHMEPRRPLHQGIVDTVATDVSLKNTNNLGFPLGHFLLRCLGINMAWPACRLSTGPVLLIYNPIVVLISGSA